MDLFLSFDGRIRRGQWWLGVIILFVAALVLNLVIAAVLGAGFFGQLIGLLVMLAFFYPALALATKRLADRGKPPMPRLALFYGPGLLSLVMQTFGIGYRPMGMGQFGEIPEGQIEGMPMGEFQGMEAMVPGAAASIILFISFVAAIWALVELGFLRGDEGPNAYGPPPA